MKSTSKICTFDTTRDCSLNHNVMSVKLNSNESENKSKVLIVSKLQSFTFSSVQPFIMFISYYGKAEVSNRMCAI